MYVYQLSWIVWESPGCSASGWTYMYGCSPGNVIHFSYFAELVDCDTVDQGCNGGLPANAYKQIMKLGELKKHVYSILFLLFLWSRYFNVHEVAKCFRVIVSFMYMYAYLYSEESDALMPIWDSKGQVQQSNATVALHYWCEMHTSTARYFQMLPKAMPKGINLTFKLQHPAF